MVQNPTCSCVFINKGLCLIDILSCLAVSYPYTCAAALVECCSMDVHQIHHTQGYRVNTHGGMNLVVIVEAGIYSALPCTWNNWNFKNELY